jgi:hypothetical protein
MPIAVKSRQLQKNKMKINSAMEDDVKKRFIISTSVVFRSALGIVALLTLNSVAQAQQTLGGLDLRSYCEARYGRNVHLIGSTVNDWRCGRSSFSVNAACRWTYGHGARAAYRSFDDPNSWYCYR